MAESSEARVTGREDAIVRTFVDLAGSLVEDFDVIDLLTVLVERSIELLDAANAAILLADASGHLRVLASSNEQVGLLELVQLQNDEGPCLDCFNTGEVVISPDLRAESRWPRFSTESVRAGLPSVCAIPLRHRNRILGCLNLFMVEPRGLPDADVRLAVALAAAASVTMIQDQAARDAVVREGQLQHALDSRVTIEQAKGMIAERTRISMDEAFARLRTYARNGNLRLSSVAEDLVRGTVALDAVAAVRPTGPAPAPQRPPPRPGPPA